MALCGFIVPQKRECEVHATAKIDENGGKMVGQNKSDKLVHFLFKNERQKKETRKKAASQTQC